MSLKQILRAFTLFTGPGLIFVANASVAPLMRSVGTRGFELSLDGATVSVQMLAPGVLHVHYLPLGEGTPPSLVIDPQHARWAAFAPEVARRNGAVTLRSQRMQAAWDPEGETLTVTDAHGRVQLRQSNLVALAQGRIVIDHARNDALYGIGSFTIKQRVTAGLLRAGKWVAGAGEQGHSGAPFVWSTAGYGVLVDCDGADFDLASGVITVSNYRRPDADYYVFVGTPAELFSDLARISGRAPMFPRWAMGFMASQWGLDQARLVHIIEGYRRRDIPLDNYILDFDWKAWGEGDYGEFRWNAKNFPDGPSGKFAKDMLARYGVHLSGIMKPRIHVNTREGRYVTADGWWLPGEKPFRDYYPLKGMGPRAHMMVMRLDFEIAAARKWWGDLAIKYGFDAGIAGWWNDEADETGNNLQFLNMERSLYDAQRAASDQRVWSLNRNFWLGAQRYAYGLWSGDIDTGFAVMARQRTRMLSAIDNGEMNWGMDSGGFNGHPTDQNYARWIEFAAFVPIFRIHGTFDQRRQPWLFGSVAEVDAVAAIRLRYSLIPYIYAYQYQDYMRGVGLVRPLTFSWPDDPNVRNDVDAWMFGKWLLVSPVMQENQTLKHIYLPAGTWTDWFTGKVYAGGQTIDLPVDAKTWRDIPLFIRAGAIIPTGPVMDYVGEHPVKSVTVEVFPTDHATHFDYYADDGTTYAYETGGYFLQPMTTRKRGSRITFTLAARTGSYQPALRDYLIAIHGSRAQTVDTGSGALTQAPTLEALKQSVAPGWAAGHDRYGDVTWVKVPAGVARTLRIETSSP